MPSQVTQDCHFGRNYFVTLSLSKGDKGSHHCLPKPFNGMRSK